jgi:release factor glutamine methyltransferase
MSTVKEAIDASSKQLQSYSDTAKLDAELLVGHLLDLSRAKLFSQSKKSLSMAQQQQLATLIARRIAGEPIAYLLGIKAFWTLDLIVNPAVLIPRPETEMLVAWALDHLPEDAPLIIADLGTGSGAIALALASERPHWRIDACDNSAAALTVAKQNAEKYRLNNVNFYLGEWCHALPRQDYHAIFGNPPYIKNDDPHLSQLTSEPLSALVSGADGLTAIRHIAAQARDYLAANGWLVLEHGYDQQDDVIAIMQTNGYRQIEDHHDLAQWPRMIVGKK